MEASTFTQQQFYTPSSSRDIDLIRTSPEYSSDPTTPTPPQTGATSTSYKILRHLDINAINPMSSEGALPDLSLAYANAHFDLEAFVERDDTEQQAALLECSHTSPPPRPNAPEDVASQRQSSSPGASLRQGALKRKRISTGELAPVERPWKRQFLVTDEHEPLAQRSTSPSSPAQLMTPSDNTVERSLMHPGTNVDTPEPVDAERMVSPCTALLNRRLPGPIGEQGNIVTSARLLNTTKSLGQRIQDPAIQGSQAVSFADSVPLGSPEQAEGDINQRSPPLRQLSSLSQSGIASMLSASLCGSPSVREDGEECFQRGPHAVPASSNLAPYGDDASSEIEDLPFRSSEANTEQAVASSAEHQETLSPDQQRTGSGTEGTYRDSDEPTPEGSVEEGGHIRRNAVKAGGAKEHFKSVDEPEEDRRAESNEQTERAHQAAAGREEQSQDNIEADGGAESDAEPDGNALPGAAAEEGGRAMTEDDPTSQTPAPQRHYTSSATTRVSDCAMLPPQPRTAMADEASSSDTHTVPRQKATGISQSTHQGPRAAPKPRRRRKQGGSTKRTQTLAEASTTAEERDECTSSSSGEDGIIQDPLIRRMQLTRESYWKFGFDIDLVFRHEFPDFEPCGISLAKSAKLTTLGQGMVAKLKLRAEAITDHLRRFTREEGMDQEVNVLRCLLKRKDIHPGHSSPIAVSTKVYQQRKGCRDMVNLYDFEMYSCMIVLRATNRPGYEALKQKIAEEKEITYLDDLRDVYHCVHCILDRLDLAWHGLHLLLALFLRASIPHFFSMFNFQAYQQSTVRTPMKKLIPLFAVSTRPAGIEHRVA
ncbi:hypothetical protein LTR75_017685 [Friedmanniomyces endolithicus]|nr:hypothetical protein LTR75_017685 [Friedmanniomyces endolithicus]KAK0847010.1 hypothetical protein LTR03_006520 [Friedmanniomyces endolithicus]